MSTEVYELKDGKWVKATPIEFEVGTFWKFKEFLKKDFQEKLKR